MKAVVTVVGSDRAGIIARVTGLLAKEGVNVEDISQTVLQGFFAMIMLVETGAVGVGTLREKATQLGKEIDVQISVLHEDIFTAMHRI
ncbi:MAG: ACT domain-containing protein [Clostridiales bacterium]|nr:ACT domain-containing protein [Clostridiales bacterium]